MRFSSDFCRTTKFKNNKLPKLLKRVLIIYKMDVKKTLKYVGQGALMVACPPLGFATLKGNFKERAMSAGVGVLLSTIASFGIGIGRGFTTTSKYDHPAIFVSNNNLNSPRGLVEVITSPLALYFDMHKATVLSSDDRKSKYSIKGDDVISFSNGRYSLNFSSEDVFDSYNGLGGESLSEARNLVENARGELEGCLSRGDIFGSRDARDNLDEAELNLKKVSKRYEETRTAFQDAVDKMNSELEELAQD